MGYRRGPAGFPAWTLTVGEMLQAQQGAGSCAVTVTCTACKVGRDVDLAAIVARKGPDVSLINRRARCRLTAGCTGWNRFHYQSGVMRPLWTEACTFAWMEADWQSRRAVSV